MGRKRIKKSIATGRRIILPERYNYIGAFLTFRCNLGCSYCINKEGSIVIKRKEMSGLDWIETINRLDSQLSITLGGGEPTLHDGFYQIVEGITPSTHKIDLLTNLQFDTDEFVRRVKPDRFSVSDIPFYHAIRASYHPRDMDKKETIEKVRKLTDSGFNIGLFGIMHPEFINDNMEMAFLCGKANVPFYVKDFLGRIDGKMYGYFKYHEGVDGIPKQAECRTRELLISPEGLVYRCHRDLYHAENPVGDIKGDCFAVEDKFRGCDKYGLCNPCDVKAKTNRYLKGIECQVEIRE